MRPKFAVGILAAGIAAAMACSSFEDSPATGGDGGTDDGSAQSPDGPSADGATITDAGVDASRAESYRQAVLADGPLAYWRMGKVDDGVVVPNEIGGGTPLLLNGSPDFTTNAPGIFGDDRAVFFGGNTAYAKAESSAALQFIENAPFTFECWAQRELHDGGDAGEYYQHIVSHVDGYSAFADQNGYLLYAVTVNAPKTYAEHGAGDAGSMQVSGNIVQPSTWAHYALVFDGTLLTLYIDGELQGIANATKGPMKARVAPFTLAKAANELRRYFRGTIDEVAVYGKPLSASALAKHVAIVRAP